MAMKVRLTQNEIELLFLWRRLSFETGEEQDWIIGEIELLLEEQSKKKSSAAVKKKPKKNNVVSLKKGV